MAGTKKKTLVLLDSHAILHRAFHALPSFTSPKGEPTGALYGFFSMLLKIITELKPDYLAACYDLPEPTFRHKFYDKYKAKRPKMSDELAPQINISKKILQSFGAPFYEAAGFEADDVLATIAEQVKKNKNLKIIIVTGDLDTLQLVRDGVEVYTMKKGFQDTILYDEKMVKERFGFSPLSLPDYKGLMGDPSDNIIGVPGIGEKTAKILIENFGTLENLYKQLKRGAIEKIGVKPRVLKLLEEHEEEAFFSKELATVRTDAPVSFSLEKSDWAGNYDPQNVGAIFQELGFKSLKQRLPGQQPKEEAKKFPERLKIAFWLLDSRRINVSLDDIFAFAGTDSIEKAEKKILEDLKKEGLYNFFAETELPLSDILSEIQERGILVDTGYLKELSKDYHKRIKILEKKIWQLAGGEFNINSPKQLSEVLFQKMGISAKGLRRTGQGVLSTRFSELEKIKNDHPIIEEIFSYRELAKLVSTYVDNLPQMVDKNSRLHTSFNQAGTVTGRFSSSEPNLQNIPVKSDFGRAVRKAFIAPPGYKLVSFDYSQVELRVAASLSGDKKLIQAFNDGKDIHAKVASEVFNVPFGKITPDMRRKAKVINFGIIYGMGINTLKKNLKCGKEEAEIFYNEYFSDFSGMAEYLEKVKSEARLNGYTTTLFGRRRYLPEINSPLEYIRKEAERMAINAPIQGTAADIIKMAMVRLDSFLKSKNCAGEVNLLLQVHDELLFEIKGGMIKEMVPLLKKIMEEDHSKLLEVSLVAEASAGENWADMSAF